MDSKKKIIIIVAVLLICLVAGFFVYKNKQEKQRNETLITAFDKLPQTLNPLYEQNSSGLILLDTIFDGITNRSGLRINDYQYGVALDLFQSENDPKLYTVELDTSIKWHDYTEENKHTLTTKDVRFTYECIMEESNNSPLRGRISKLIDRIEIVNDSELKIFFKEAISPNKVGWLLPFKIIPATYYGKAMGAKLRTDAVAQEFAKNPIGTGKYRIEEWKGNSIVLVKAWDEEIKPPTDSQPAPESSEVVKGQKINRIEVVLVHDLEKQARMLIDGKIDLVFESDPDLHKMLDGSGLRHEKYVPRHFYAIAINTKSEKFSDIQVRKALALSIDKEQLAQLVTSTNGSDYVNKGPFPHNDDKRYKKFREKYPLDIAKARLILDKVGDFKATLIYPEEQFSTMERIASKISQMASEAGITVEQKALGMAFSNQLAQKNYDLALVKHSGFTDGYNISHLYLSGSEQNITGVASETLDGALKKWENTAFWIERLPLAKIVHKKIGELCPYVYLFSLPSSAYYSPKLANVKIIDPSSLFGSVSNWRIVSKETK